MSVYLQELASSDILGKAAADAERRLDWAKAAELWQEALDNYPSTGWLAELDMRKMRRRLTACLASAKDENCAPDRRYPPPHLA